MREMDGDKASKQTEADEQMMIKQVEAHGQEVDRETEMYRERLRTRGREQIEQKREREREGEAERASERGLIQAVHHSLIIHKPRS